MNNGYCKIFSSISMSSVWFQPPATVKVWFTILIHSDASGALSGTLQGLANLAYVTLDEAKAAVEYLSSPDPDSRNPDHDGRRIAKTENGWCVLNHAIYRQKYQPPPGTKAANQRAYRQRIKGVD